MTRIRRRALSAADWLLTALAFCVIALGVLVAMMMMIR